MCWNLGRLQSLLFRWPSRLLAFRRLHTLQILGHFARFVLEQVDQLVRHQSKQYRNNPPPEEMDEDD